ncbi:TPA: neuromuscular junction development [Trebouxia sp. C0006]
MQACSKSVAGRGFAVAFFRGLAANERPEQQVAFCRSMVDGWDAAHHQSAPTFKNRLISFKGMFGQKATSSAASEELTCILCLCLTAFGPGAIVEENLLERCLAVVQNPALFNVYCAAANMIPEHAEQLMHTDAAVSGFLTSVSEVLSALAWLDNTDNLGTGSILQLSQLAAALPEMDGCSDVMVTVKLIDMRGQLEQCCQFLKFLDTDSAARLTPVAQVAEELRHVVALKEKATGQQLLGIRDRCHELFASPDHVAFVKHFAAQDSALYNAYLQQSWQRETDRLIHLRGEDDEEQEQGHERNLLLAEPAPLGLTVPAVSETIGRVLDAVHGDLAKLLNEDNLQLGFLDVARQYLAGKDESAELQVVAEYFYPAADPHREQAVTAQRSIRVVTRLNNIKDAIAVTQWADALPHILITIKGNGLSKCQDASFKTMQNLAQGKLALDTLSTLGFQEAAGVLESVRQCCGELSGPEKMLFRRVNACNAFWSFIKQEKFYGIEGSRRFDSQVSLVTGQLMSEVYDAGVLADVQQAQRIVGAFLTAESFSGLLHNVRELHLDAGSSGQANEAGMLLPAVACLEAAVRHMELILNWFSNNSEQKIQTTKCVSKLYLNRHQEHNPVEFDEKIDILLGCYKEVLGIQGVKQQLRAAGHPDHQYTPDDIVYELAHGLQHLEEAAVDLQQVLASWQDNIKAIHDQYNLSLFLSTHQLVAASDLLKALLSDGEAGGQLHSLRALLMLVPTLGDMSNATLKTAFESMQADEQQETGRIGHLEAVGHLMQLLTSMKPPQVARQQHLGQRVVVAPDQAADAAPNSVLITAQH